MKPKPFRFAFAQCLIATAVGLLCHASTFAAVPIPSSQAASLSIPAISGDGVSIRLFNGIGGGAAPTPSAISGRTPDGTTLSPFIDFPRPGTTINVGQSFTTFFTSTTNPPDQVKSLAARNFILEIDGYLSITTALDRDTSTSGIDLRLGVGSDDGFYLVAGSTFLGSTGDRAFATTSFDVTFAQPGLYPVKLLFAANSVGFSGLEFYWQVGNSASLQLVPQSALYTTTILGQQLVNFDDQPAGTLLADQYRNLGLIMGVSSGTLQITNALPSDFIPVTQPNVVGCPTSAPSVAQTLEMSFVVPDTSQPAITDFIEFYLIDADTAPGTHITATNQHGQTVFDQSIVTGGGVQQKVTIAAPQIFHLRLELGGAGADTAAIDNVAFNTPSAADLIPPSVAATRITGSSVEIDFQDAVGLNASTALLLANYEILASGGDKLFGSGNDRTVAIASATMLDADTLRLTPSTALGDELYRLIIKEAPGVRDTSGNLLDGDSNGQEGGAFQQVLTLDLQSATLQLELAATSDTGVASNDRITSQTQPTLDVVVNEAGNLTLSIDGQQMSPRLAEAQGAQSFVVPSALADGSHSATAIFDAATPSGSPLQRGLSFVVDTTPPVVNSVSFNAATFTDGSFVRESGVFTAVVSDAGGVNRVEFSIQTLGGQTILNTTDSTPTNGLSATWDVTAIPDGPYVLTVRAYDWVNLVTTTTRSFTKAPPLPLLTLSLAQATVTEGSSLGGTVSIDKVWPQDIVVALGVTTANRISFPATITIPTGQTSAAFNVQ